MPCRECGAFTNKIRFKFPMPTFVEGVDVIEEEKGQCLAMLQHYFAGKRIKGVEIGTMCGALTYKMLNELPDLYRLVTIDMWAHVPDAPFEAGHPQEWHDRQKDEAASILTEFSDRVEVMHVDSATALKLLGETGEKFDFVWVDGSHQYIQAYIDVKRGFDLLNDHGVIGGTNFNRIIDVTVAVGKFFKDKKLKFHKGGDYIWWYKK